VNAAAVLRMAKPKPASITLRRDEAGTYGFDCACGYAYTIPTGRGLTSNNAHNLVDAMVRYHENRHKLGKIK